MLIMDNSQMLIHVSGKYMHNIEFHIYVSIIVVII